MGKPKYIKSLGYRRMEIEARNGRIRDIYKKSKMSQEELAKEFELSTWTIRRILQEGR